MLSPMVERLRPSPILAMAEQTRQAVQAGHSVIDLTLGEPDFPTPEHICVAAIEAIRAGHTHYTAVNGTVALREAIQRKFERDNNLRYGLDEINVGCGAKQIIYQAFAATLRPGDEVAVPIPYWSSYADMIGMFGGVVRPVPTSAENGFLAKPADLRRALNDKTRWVLFNSPSNPCGCAYSEAQLLELAEAVWSHPNQGIWVMADDIYEHILYDGRRHATIAQVEPRLRDRTLSVNGVSKAYAMTGWRVGYSGGPRELASAMTKIQMQINSHTSAISQAAAVAALDGPQAIVAERRELFQARRDRLIQRLESDTPLEVATPAGAFYLFPSCEPLLGRHTPDGQCLESDMDAAQYLLQAGVAMVPGSGFGAPGYLRMSYAASTEQLDAAVDRLAQAIQVLT